MKQCPQCRQNFSDDTHFCLSDGTPLIFVNSAPEEVTVVRPNLNIHIPEEETIVKPNLNINNPAPPVKQGVSPIFAYLTVGLLLLLIGGGVILLAIFAYGRISNTNTETAKISNSTPVNTFSINKENGKSLIDEQKANLQRQQDQIEKERQKLEDERKKLNEEKTKPLETPPPVPSPPPVNYPPQPTARIKFGRGRVAESVSGKIYTQRSFVLEARSGQYLSASVNGGGCVVFSNGSSSVGFTTSSGDNRLTLVNNCNSEASFSLTVAIR